jgi:hypothetical protein
MNKEVQEFYDANSEQLEQAYEEQLQYMQDSAEHINYMRSSDACFWEFVKEQYYKQLEAV